MSHSHSQKLAAPQLAAPQLAAPQLAAPQLAPQQLAPQQLAPQRLTPQQVVSQQAAPPSQGFQPTLREYADCVVSLSAQLQKQTELNQVLQRDLAAARSELQLMRTGFDRLQDNANSSHQLLNLLTTANNLQMQTLVETAQALKAQCRINEALRNQFSASTLASPHVQREAVLIEQRSCVRCGCMFTSERGVHCQSCMMLEPHFEQAPDAYDIDVADSFLR
jgi:hypothetical protein